MFAVGMQWRQIWRLQKAFKNFVVDASTSAFTRNDHFHGVLQSQQIVCGGPLATTVSIETSTRENKQMKIRTLTFALSSELLRDRRSTYTFST